MDRKKIIKKTREYMKQNSIDYLVINTCDEFLLEYNELKNCARYIATGFSGSSGDALLSQDKMYLFADGRYHIQAEQETDKELVEIVKLQLNERYSNALIERIEPYSTLAIVATKISLNFFNIIKPLADEKNIKVKFLEEDLIFHYSKLQPETTKHNLYKIPKKIAGETFSEKIIKIRKEFSANEAVLFTKLEDVAYITNLRGNYMQNSSCFKGYLFVSQIENILFCDDEVPLTDDVKVVPLSKFNEDLKSYAQKYKIVFEQSAVNLSIYNIIKKNCKKISSNDGRNIFNLKSFKNTNEIACYKEAYRQTDEVVEYINELVNSDKNFSEFELAEIVENEFKKRGAKDLSFKTIMAFGANSAIIHYTKNAKERFLSDGDFVLLDCGAYFDGGYATDITRTFFRGNPNNLQKKVYTTVLKGFIASYKFKTQKQLTGNDLDNTARNVLNEMKDEGFAFSHSTGHGVGISVHEGPPFVSCSKLGEYPLQSGMIFSIEPGLYKENFGGVRLENIVYIDENKNIISLSKAKFEEKLIDYTLLDEQEKLFVNEWNKK